MPSVMVEPQIILNDGTINIVDARRRQEYEKDHIPGAISLPLWDLLEDESPQNIARLAGQAGIDGLKKTVVYDNAFGAVAARVAWTLELIGHRSVSLLSKTFSNWKKLGLPISTDIVTPDPVVFTMEQNDTINADLEDVSNETANHTIIDNRDRLNFLSNHIPGAVNIPHHTLADLENESILRSPSELKRLFENRNINTNVQIITYCGSAGTLSGLAYYALKSANIQAKIYSKSFRDWTANEKTVETQPDANYWDLSAE